MAMAMGDEDLHLHLRRARLLQASQQELVRAILAAGAGVAQEVLDRLELLPPGKGDGRQGQGQGQGQGQQETAEGNSRSRKAKRRGELKQMDFSKVEFQHIAIKFMYDGSGYGGLSSQQRTADGVTPTGILLPAVEDKLFAAMEKTRLIESRASAAYSRCGRTDKGVSAFGQVVSFRARCIDASSDYCSILNRVLPEDIRCISWAPVPCGFSARFCSTGRTYRYFFIKRRRDLAAMNEAAKLLVGDHDFRNLCKMNPAQISNFRRVVRHAEVKISQYPGEGDRQVCVFEIQGAAFLWHQIRCIMSVLFMVGEGLEEPDVISHLLDIEACPARPSYKMASDKPLVLHDCAFDGLPLQMDVKTLVGIQSDLELQWEESMLKAARLFDAISELGACQISGEELERAFQQIAKKHDARVGNFVGGPCSTPDGLVTWKDAAEWLHQTKLCCTIVPGERADLHTVPLRNRKLGPSLGERVQQMGQSKLTRLNRHLTLKESQSDGFYTAMQSVFTDPKLFASLNSESPLGKSAPLSPGVMGEE